jgi:hypothetical protein
MTSPGYGFLVTAQQVAMRLMEIRNAEREWQAQLPPAQGLLPVCAEEIAEKHMRQSL